MKLVKKIETLRIILLEIISKLNLEYTKTSSFKDLIEILKINNLVNDYYYNKIRNLDLVDKKHLEGQKTLKKELNDIQLFLELRFYHYI
ncbi:MAG: hypothetical protein ACTSRG_01240 [Candidatus Helarchaeota archaeon]